MFKWTRAGARSLALICLVCTGAVALMYWRYFAPWIQLELAARDIIVRYGKIASADPSLVFLAIDRSSTVLDGVSPEEIEASPALALMAKGWPWSRDVYPHVIQRVADAGARVIAFD